MTFKIGDKVRYNHGQTIHTITSISPCGKYYRVDDETSGNSEKAFTKVEDKPMFKYNVGDTVKVVKKTGYFGHHKLEIGKEYKIKQQYKNGSGKFGYRLENIDGSTDTLSNHVGEDEIKKVEDTYEDGWILNDGKVTIPDDAQKSMHEGSVVAFRKRKPVVFNFGDKVMYEDGTIYIFITNTQPGWCHGIKETSQCCTTLNLNKLTKV